MPTRNSREYDNCLNTETNESNITITNVDEHETDSLNHVIIAVVTVVGLVTLLTFIVSIWSIRRCYLNKKIKRSWDINPVKNEVDQPTRPEGFRPFSESRLPDMYGGSLKDLRRHSDGKEVKLVVQRSLHSAYSQNFLHHGDHNNTIIQSLAATWSIQTLPQPRHPGEVVLTKAADNPLYATPVILPKKNASSNALYQSADDILLKTVDFKPLHCSRKSIEPKVESPVYERIIEYPTKTKCNLLDYSVK